MTHDEFVSRVEDVSYNGGWYVGRCPAHADNVASFSVKDYEEGDQAIVFVCHAGCRKDDILKEMGIVTRNGDANWAALWYDTETQFTPAELAAIDKSPEAEYLYTDEDGALLYKVVRYPGKRFKHERRFVPYRLPSLTQELPDKLVYIVEGEKDVHALEDHGRLATCNAGGAGSWKQEWGPLFQSASVIIWADKDEPGMSHALTVADSLFKYAVNITIVQSREGKDAADHLEAGYSPDDYEIVRVVKGREMVV